MFLGIPGGALPSVPVLAVVLALLVVNELMPVELPSGGYATASAVFFLPCLVVLGPFWTAALDVAATLLVQGLVLRRPAVRMLYNAANFAVTDFLAGLAFLALGGRVGSFDLVAHAGPLVVAGGVYFLVNSLLVSTIIGLTAGPDPWRVWERNFQHGILHHISFLALGVLATAAYFAVGPWALVLFAIPFGVARHSFRLYVEIRSDLKDFVRALSEVLEEVDPYTRHHSARVAEYAVRLARGLQLSERRVEEIEYAAFVHDIGKIGPQHQHILQKPGSLTHEEQRTLRTHPAAGAEIVQKVRALRRVSDIVRSHHERPDGLGYPFGLRASDVPVGARILNVADAFDAMTSDRPYRRALSLSEAIAELKRGSGTQFDAEVVSCLIRMHDAGQFPLLPSPSSEDLLQLRVHPLRARA
jgi:putative nucleotidyltransferase with HDIG domain